MRYFAGAVVMVCAGFGAAFAAGAQDRAGVNLSDAVAVPGGVAQLDMAQRLFALAGVQRDAVLAAAAARLVAGVLISGVQTPEPGIGPDLGAMLAAARGFAADDDAVLGVIDGVAAAGAWGQISGAKRQEGVVEAGASMVITQPFFGDATAELGLWGDGTAPLSVEIADENGNAVPCPVRAGAAFYCAFVPLWNGNFVVTVTNAGTAPAGYALVTN